MKDKYDIRLYLDHRPFIKNGDVLEWRSETILGKSIRAVTGYNVNHASQIVTFDDFYHNKPLRIYTLEALSHGIELNLVSRRLEDFKGKIYWLPLKEHYNDKRFEISRHGLERIGIPYDYTSIKQIFFKFLFFGSHSIKSSIDKLYCSEYTFYNGKDSGLPIVDKFKKIVPVPGEMYQTNWYRDKILIHDTENE